MEEFAPKGEETLRTEALEDLGLDAYEGNEEVVDRVVARLKSSEDFKASVHGQKKEHQTKAEKRAEMLKKNGFDPETGEKLATNVVVEPKTEGMTAKDVIAIRDLHEADLEFVMAEAKLRSLTLSETKTLPHIQNTLKLMGEERRTAEATVTRTTSKSTTKGVETELVKKADKMQLSPDEMAEGAKALINEVFGKK